MFITKAFNFCKKYWKALLAGILVFVGYIIGSGRNSRKTLELQLAKNDSDEKIKSIKKQIENEAVLTVEHDKKIKDLQHDHVKKIKSIEQKTKKNIEKLSNNDESLDKILKEKYNLKKGE